MEPAIVRNSSRLSVFAAEHRFYNGHQYNLLVAKCTYALLPGGTLKPLAEQPAIVFNDITEDGEPWSSLRYPSDLIPYKPKVDVLVVGTARPENGQPATAWGAEITIGDWRKQLKLTGPRQWQHSALRGWRLENPTPTTGVALRYELAYGGLVGVPAQPETYYEFNPLGRGFIGRRQDVDNPLPAPQIEYFDAPVKSQPNQAVRVAGFSPMPDYFENRARLGGTWPKATDTPVAGIPLDMDLRFWNTAPEDQQLDHLLPGSKVRLIGLLPEPVVQFQLPDYLPRAILYMDNDETDTRQLPLDTMHIDLDTRRVTLRWSNLIDFDEGVRRITMWAPEVRIPG